MSTWSFVTNHGAILSLLAHEPQITARDIAARLHITERSVLRIIADLEAEGYLKRTRDGRVNRYEVNHDLPLRRHGMRDITIGELLKILKTKPDEQPDS